MEGCLESAGLPDGTADGCKDGTSSSEGAMEGCLVSGRLSGGTAEGCADDTEGASAGEDDSDCPFGASIVAKIVGIPVESEARVVVGSVVEKAWR